MGGRTIKVVGGLVAAILIGAIGSGVWEAALKPLLVYGAELIVALFSFLSSAFKDSVYREAAEGFHEKHSLVLITFIYGVMGGLATSIMLLGPLRGWLRQKIRTRLARPDNTPEVTTRTLFVSSVLVVSILALGLFVTARESYVNRITTWSLTSIERLNSALTPAEYSALRAEFYRVNGANDFYAFHSRLTALAKDKAVALRDFEPL